MPRRGLSSHPGLLPNESWPHAMNAPFAAEACLPEVFQPAWPAVANAAALQAATMALQESLGRGEPADIQQLMAAHSAWALAASATATPMPNPFLPPFLPQPLAPGLAETRRPAGADSDKRDLLEDGGMAELDLAVTKLLEGCDDSSGSCGQVAVSGDVAGEVPTTPPPRRCGGEEPSNGTPAKVACPYARSSSPEPPPGLRKRGDQGLSSPVQLKLSGVAFPGGSPFGEEQASNLLFDLPPFLVDGADACSPLLSAPPGIAVAPSAVTPDREGGAFLLNLLKAGNSSDKATTPALKGRKQGYATPASTLSPTTASNASSIADDTAADAQHGAGGRRPTRRGRRAGQIR